MANISRWDPLDELFRGFFVRPVEFNSQLAEAPSIKIDVKESPEGFAVHAELPGIKKEDIHVSIDGAVVSVSAERRQEKETKESERVLRSERYFGKVSRSFQLASEIDEARATAKFNDGVLELTLPKKTSAHSRRLSIQ
ncbi:MAG TPA: Hsp20/alpha crystallin family protein [Rhodocyclaceae bacterium]|nr:Hsp20/alpha crystallin family protein [Rhodocyclaceae bacterium]HNA02971.1 Hsp20/alpha crystallin family protein [Rhodocyclaceae bacterium]HNB78085.1 Hsp20/alpha crystallin family protein [Rhodocyclaceae bacterium]HNC60536.1 Hsp20/alpha crystallin family protein [Rhodocyclaceae bacterium]HNH13624.1 Hsp20/alpha crystallin family protein [Rhodocyclaceae bacterium]